MLLAIDVGNTNSVFALHDPAREVGDFVDQWRCSTDATRTADEYYVWLARLMARHGVEPEAITGVAISATAPRTVFNLRVLCDRYFGLRPVVVGKDDAETGVTTRVDPQTRVGPDRIVNTLAGHRLYGGNLIIVDYGTATTLDVVGEDGAYEGGVIAPGVNLSLRALHEAAAALPDIDVSQPDAVVGTNTLACMQSGIFWGYIGLVEGLCARIAAERGQEMKVIGTGGLSALFDRGTDVIDVLDLDLTVKGLVMVHALNA